MTKKQATIRPRGIFFLIFNCQTPVFSVESTTSAFLSSAFAATFSVISVVLFAALLAAFFFLAFIDTSPNHIIFCAELLPTLISLYIDYSIDVLKINKKSFLYTYFNSRTAA